MIIHIPADREFNDDITIDDEAIEGLADFSLINYNEHGKLERGAASIDRTQAQQIVDHLTRVFDLSDEHPDDPLKFEEDQHGREVLRTPSGYEIGGAGDNIIGLSRTLYLSEGFDSTIVTPEPDDDPRWSDPQVTSADCIAIADHMLARWKKFREKHAALAAA